MIAFVKGTVSRVDLTSAVLEVGGVGLELMCTPRTLADLHTGQTARLPTAMIVREDSMTLFGFAGDDEKQLFEMLLTASGVGPKLAQAMLAVHTPDEIRRAVSTDDVKTLTRVPGIGQKGAQRIILELRDRIGSPVGGASSGRAPAPAAAAGWQDQVSAGLVGLGWSAKEADRAVTAVTPRAEGLDQPDVARLLRAALQTLGRT